jgi:hypothetical protein
MSIATRSESYTAGVGGASSARKLASFDSETTLVVETNIQDVGPIEDEDPTGLFSGIRIDIRNRARCYWDDWKVESASAFVSLLAPATYIFFASVIPALTFGEQIYTATDGQFGGAQVLLPTAINGLLQAILGGQPLLIVGVAEPIVLVYIFMYDFCIQQDIAYRPFCAATLYWAALFIVILAAINACKYIHTFTRFAGELFGFLIALLFMQQGIKGLRDEYRMERCLQNIENMTDSGIVCIDEKFPVNETNADDLNSKHWLMFNGTWALFLALGLVVSTWDFRKARDWNYFKGPVRKFVAEYATFITVLAWTGISFAGSDLLPDGIPRRLKIDKTLEAPATDTWYTVNNMDELSTRDIFIAIVPALVITIMNVFDHNVSAQLAQVEEFKLKKPHAYHWDFFLQGLMTALCGACGILPVNGVIPQSPLHTKACAEFIRDKDGNKSKDSFRIREQRWTNLIQALLVTACLFITEALKQVPRSVLWGFFIFMACESLPGSQFFERMQLLITDSKRLKKIVRGEHNEYLDKVPFGVIVKFTLCQFFGFSACYAISQVPNDVAPIGIFFPTLIMLLVPMRIHLFPKIFSDHDLYYLDPRIGAVAPDDHGNGVLVAGSAAKLAQDEGDEDPDAADALKAAGIGSNGLTTATRRNVSGRAAESAV